MSTESSVDARTLEETRQQLRHLVSEIASISKENLSPEAYFEQFLPRVVTALAAHGGAVWLRGDGRRVQLVYQINLRETGLGQSQEHQAQHGRMLQKVFESGEGALVPAHSGSADPEGPGNPTRFLLVLAPIRHDEEIEGVIEIFQRSDTRPDSQRGYLQFLMQMSESAADWLRGRKLRHITDQQSLWAQVDHYAQAVHDNLHPRDTAFTIANEGRRLIGCDRVSVAILRGQRCYIEAVSGQDTFDKRSNTIAYLQKLATRVVAAGDPLWYTGHEEDLPPQLEEAIHNYVDEAHSKTVAVIPMRRPVSIEVFEEGQVIDDEMAAGTATGAIIGALIVEQIEDERPQSMLGRQVEIVKSHGERALANALEHNDLFLMPVWRLIGKSKFLVQAKTLPKTVLASVAILVFLALMFFWRVDFDLKANGALQPVNREMVFVDQDGVVVDVLVDHNEMVAKGQPLVKLRNTDLDVRLADVSGQLQTVGKQLQTINNLIYAITTQQQDRDRLKGEQAQLLEQQDALQRQLKLLEQKREQLTILSPVDGQVITWNVKEQLMRRPVTTGQVLMTVADLKGDWEVELAVPEKRMGYVLREQLREQEDPKLKEKIEAEGNVKYYIATDPNIRLSGWVKGIELASELDRKEGQSVKLLVAIKKQQLIDKFGDEQLAEEILRPGASVTARVHCGRSSLGFYWFHELIEFVQAKILF